MNVRPLIIGHRGASAHAPENTIAAFQMALLSGADGVEFDVRLSRDGIPVVIHDASLKRTGNRYEKVADLTAAELGKVDVGSWFNERYPRRAKTEFARETVPTLVQVLEILKNGSGLIYIELKCGTATYNALARAVCDVIRHSPMLSRVIVKSFKLAAIPVVRNYLHEVQTAALFEPKVLTMLRKRKHITTLAAELGAQQISIHTSLATRKLVDLAAGQNLPVTIWTADKTSWAKKSAGRGIRALITNDPAKMLTARKKLPG